MRKAASHAGNTKINEKSWQFFFPEQTVGACDDFLEGLVSALTQPLDDRTGIEPWGGHYISVAKAPAADSPNQYRSQSTCRRSGMSLSEINAGEEEKEWKSIRDKAFGEQSRLSSVRAGSKALDHRTSHHEVERNSPK